MMSSCVGENAIDDQCDGSDNAKNSLAQMKSSVPAAWNKPSNNDVVPVMGAVSWPALSDSANARVLPKLAPESVKTLSNGSVSIPQGSVMGSPPKEQLPISANPNSNQNNAVPTPRQKSGNAVVHVSSPNDHSQKRNNWEEGPRGRSMTQPRGHVNNHPHPPNTSRKNNYGGRRDQERPNSDLNSHNRGFKSRNFEMQQHQPQSKVVTRNYTPPPAPVFSPQPFPGPVPVGSIVNAPVPFPTPFPPPMGGFVSYGMPPQQFGYYPFVTYAADIQLRDDVVKQIEYYFSDENLCKDAYLRRNMDEEGFVPIIMISNFNKVKQLTNNINYIINALRFSNVVEVLGDKVRRKTDWMKWLFHPSNSQLGSVSGAQSQGILNTDTLESRIENLGLEQGTATNSSSTLISSNESQTKK